MGYYYLFIYFFSLIINICYFNYLNKKFIVWNIKWKYFIFCDYKLKWVGIIKIFILEKDKYIGKVIVVVDRFYDILNLCIEINGIVIIEKLKIYWEYKLVK